MLSKDFLPNTLVLGPGGLKGFLELGAIKFFEHIGFIDNVNTIVGVSVGSIIGLLLICGYTVDEIVKEAIGVELLQDFSSLDIKKIQEKLGLFDNEVFRKLLQKLVRIKYGMIPTMKQLYDATGIRFAVIAYNSSKEQTYIITAKSDPNLECTEATMLSSNIPFLLYQLKYKDDVFIDGAFGNPYPIDLYDSFPESLTLGIYIEGAGVDPSNHGDNLFPYVNRVIHSSLNELRKKIIATSSNRCFHVELKTLPSKSDFQFSKEERIKMVNHGYMTAKRIYCEKFNLPFDKDKDKDKDENHQEQNQVQDQEQFQEEEEIPVIVPISRDKNENENENEDQEKKEGNYVYVPITPQLDEIMKDLSKLNTNNVKLVIPKVTLDDISSFGNNSNINRTHKLPPCIGKINKSEIDKIPTFINSNMKETDEKPNINTNSNTKPNYLSLMEKYLSEIDTLQNSSK